MWSGIINIVLGCGGIAFGLNGGKLMFTNSSEALIGVGAVIAATGVYQIWRDRRR